MIPFAERLKEARKQKNLKQREVAEHLQITQHSYQQYESGTRRPNFETLLALAAYLDVTTDYLLGADQYTPSKIEGPHIRRLTVNLPGREYDILIARGLLAQTGERVRTVLPRAHKLAVVTDSNVDPLYSGAVMDSLEEAGFEGRLFVVPAGEESKNPSQLAALWEGFMDFGLTRADAVAALEKFTPPIITIDMGTATTIGVISEGRTYEGGLLLPGVNVSLEALSRRAAQLPDISLQHPKSLIGKNTEDCMRSGIVYGTAGMLDGIIDRIRGLFPDRKVSVVATGGNAPVIVRYCRNPIIYDKFLLMDGLWTIYQKNR